MPWQGTNGITFNPFSVRKSVPPQPGVYVLYRPNERPIYVGASADLRARLLDHLTRADDRIIRHEPTLCAYEIVPEHPRRLARETELILELNPVCNAERSAFSLAPRGDAA